MFDKLLKKYCEENDFEIREYSGRNYAKDLMAIVIPNGMRSFGMFVHEFSLKLIEAERELKEQKEDLHQISEAFELWEDFIQTLEFDSLGRDDQVIYSRNFKWIDFQNATEEDQENED